MPPRREECDSVIAIEPKRSPARVPVYLNSLMLNFVGSVVRGPVRRRIRALALRARPPWSRCHLRRHPDDRAGAHAHFLGHDVLPLRVPRHLDRVVWIERKRRLRVRAAARVRAALDREPPDDALAALRRRDRPVAGRARENSRRAQLLAREPRQDDRHLHAGSAAVFLGRRRHLAGDHAAQHARQRRVCRGSDRRGGGMSPVAAAAESIRRTRGGAAGRGAGRRRGVAVLARPHAGANGPRRGGGRRHPRTLAVVGIGAVRCEQHQGARRRHGAVRQVEFVLARGGVRPVSWRLVAELEVSGRQTRNALHGHRLGRVHADRAFRRRPVKSRVPEIRTDRPRLPPGGV